MNSEVGYTLGWVAALLLAVLAMVRAARHDTRERAARRSAVVLAAGRRDAALGLLGELDDADVREAWPVICAVLEEGALTTGDDVRELAAALASGGGRQLAEEVAIEASDESPERVTLYHMRFVRPTVECRREGLVRALRQLAVTLDALEADASIHD